MATTVTQLPILPKPFLVILEAARTYFWCACGRSASQPFCDGAHTNLPAARLSIISRDRLRYCYLVTRGGRAIVSGREFEVNPHDGVYVRPGEALQLVPAGQDTLGAFALSSP